MKLHSTNGLVLNVPLDLNAKTIQLMAYLAWRRGTAVKRSELIKEIWERERVDEEDIDKLLGWSFDGATKALRGVIPKVLDTKDTNLNIIRHKNQLWWLSPSCKVIDLEAIENSYQMIIDAKKRGELVNAIPEHIKDACYRLISAYSGDFCEGLLKRYPLDVRTWADMWIREPITYYRDCYLWAIWYAAQYEQQAGQYFAGEQSASDIVVRQKQRECWARAAELY